MGDQKQTVALTGGTGFLGIHLIHELDLSGYSIRLLNRPGSKHPLMKEYPKSVEVRELDFTSPSDLEKALLNCDVVIHAAGLVSYNRCDQKNMYAVHVELTKAMIVAAKKSGVRRFIHVSSIVTLGHSRELRDETSEYNAAPLSLDYWDTKTQAEKIALAANSADFEVISMNPGSLLGSGEKNGQLVPFLRKIAGKETLILPDGGSDFLDVRDAAKAIVTAIKKGTPGERYVLGSENLTYSEFHKRVRQSIGLGSQVKIMPRWLLSVLTKILEVFEFVTRIDLPINAARLRRVNGVYMFHDLKKSKNDLGYSPRPIDQAIREMLLAAFKENSE